LNLLIAAFRRFSNRIGLLLNALPLVVLALAPQVACAVDPTQELSELSHTSWTTREGAPGDISCLGQTPDGFLWIGSTAGLYRFDGLRFERFRSQAGDESLNFYVTALIVDHSGSVWVGSQFGGVHRLEGGRVTSWSIGKEVTPHAVTTLVEAPDGHIFAIVGSHVLFEFDGQDWRQSTSGFPGGFTNGIRFQADGTIWATDGRTISVRDPGDPSFSHRVTGRYPITLVNGKAGSVWYSDLDVVGKLGQTPETVPLQHLGMHDATGASTQFVLFDREGTVWARADTDLARLAPSPEWLAAPNDSMPPKFQRLSANQRLAGGSFRTAFEDREGNVWIGSNGGLDRFKSTKFRRVLANGGPIAKASVTSAKDGSIWMGGDSVPLAHWQDGAVTSQSILFETSPHGGIMTVDVDMEGVLWLGGRSELRRNDGTGFERIALPAEPEFTSQFTTPIQAIDTDSEHGLWLATPRSLHKLLSGNWTVQGKSTGLPAGSATSLRGQPNGTFWIGYMEGEVARIQHGGVRLFGPSEGFAAGPVMAMTSDGDDLWAGGADGLVVYRQGRFISVLSEDGSPIGGISGIVKTASGDLWLNTTIGVVRIPSSEVAKTISRNSIVRVAGERYGGEDGIDGTPTTVRPLPTAALSDDGRVFISTTKGIFQIDPQHIQRNAIAPQVVMEGLASDGTEHGAATTQVLSPETAIVDISYTAASLTTPQEVKFRYRLHGFESAWRMPSDHRNATYTNLRPGSYRFAVQAANEDGIWGAVNEDLAFTIEPHYWQTVWFRTLCVAATLCLLWILYATHLRRVAQRLKIKIEARTGERERIARELHDTLLQGTLGLVLNFQVVANKMAKDDPQRGRVKAIIDQAERAVEEARDRVLRLRSGSSSGDSLDDALRRAGLELAKSSNVEFSLVHEGSTWIPNDEDSFELFLIGREALFNAFQHANPTKVEVTLVADDQELVLTVRDNGTGMDQELIALRLKEGHLGIVGMRERARRLGAELTITSTQGQGTEIRLTMAKPLDADSWRRTQAIRDLVRRWTKRN